MSDDSEPEDKHVPPHAEEAKPSPIVEPVAPSEATKPSASPDMPADRLKAELLALFDSETPAGERKSQAAALIKSLLDLAPAPTQPRHTEEPSGRVTKRLNFLPVRPKVQYEQTTLPTSPYDKLKRPN